MPTPRGIKLNHDQVQRVNEMGKCVSVQNSDTVVIYDVVVSFWGFHGVDGAFQFTVIGPKVGICGAVIFTCKGWDHKAKGEKKNLPLHSETYCNSHRPVVELSVNLLTTFPRFTSLAFAERSTWTNRGAPNLPCLSFWRKWNFCFMLL